MRRLLTQELAAFMSLQDWLFQTVPAILYEISVIFCRKNMERANGNERIIVENRQLKFN